MLKKVIIIIVGFVSFLSGAAAVYIFLEQKYAEVIGINENNIQIVNMKLLPSIHFFKREFGYYSTAQISLTVRNFGNEKIQLTSYILKIDKESLLKITDGSSMGKNILNEDPKKSNSIFIKAGEEKIFYLSRSINLSKIMPFFKTKEFESSIYTNLGNNRFILHNMNINKKFNAYLKNIYKDTKVEIQLFTGYKNFIKEHKVEFSKGITIFENNGAFQHDTFLAKVFAVQKGDYDFSLQFK